MITSTRLAFLLQIARELNKVYQTTIFRHWTKGSACLCYETRETKRIRIMISPDFYLEQGGKQAKYSNLAKIGVYGG